MVVDSTEYRHESPIITSAAGADVQLQSRKRTFNMDRTYATVLAKHCSQPLRRLFISDKASGPALLKHAARATKFGRHTSHPAGFVPNTTVANNTTHANANTTTTNANANTSTAISLLQHPNRKMEGFWEGPGYLNGFMTSMHSDEHAVGK